MGEKEDGDKKKTTQRDLESNRRERGQNEKEGRAGGSAGGL